MSQQVKQRIEENPDDIDEVPIKANHLNGDRALRQKQLAADGSPQYEPYECNPAGEMQSVNPGADVVEIDKDLGGRMSEGLACRRAGNDAVGKIEAILECLDDKENNSQYRREAEIAPCP